MSALYKTIETGIVILLKMALHMLHKAFLNVFVRKPVALYHKKLFCRILSRLGIEWDVILFGV